MQISMKNSIPIILRMYLVLQFCCFLGYARAEKDLHQKKYDEWMTMPIVLQGKKMTFDEGIESLATQIKLPFYADGEPKLLFSDIDLKTNAKEALNKFCDTFDYYWVVSKQNAILLKKRFRNPEELPQMHFREIFKMTEDVLKSLTSLEYDVVKSNKEDIFNTLYSSLSKRQLQYFQSRKLASDVKEIAYNDLSKEQKILVEQAILSHSLLDSVEHWRKLSYQMQSVPSVYLFATSTQRQPGIISLSSPLLTSLRFTNTRYYASDPNHGNTILIQSYLRKELK